MRPTALAGTIALIAIIPATLLVWQPWLVETGSGESPVMLHVIPHSDEDIDQAAKIVVRDRVIAHLRGNNVLADAGSAAETVQVLAQQRGEIAAIAAQVLNEYGRSYDVSVKIGRRSYGERQYRGFIVPAGQHPAVNIVLGAGAGANWWCIVFPAICLTETPGVADAIVTAGDDPGTAEIGANPTPETETPQIEARSAVLDWVRRQGSSLRHGLSSLQRLVSAR